MLEARMGHPYIIVQLHALAWAGLNRAWASHGECARRVPVATTDLDLDLFLYVSPSRSTTRTEVRLEIYICAIYNIIYTIIYVIYNIIEYIQSIFEVKPQQEQACQDHHNIHH